MKNPTLQELMEYVDGTLHPMRYQEIDVMISTSPRLQKEIALLKAMQRTVQNDVAAKPSKKFISNVMKDVLPLKEESIWERALKNSSNLFATILVLTMIGIVLVSSPTSSGGGSNVLTKKLESYNVAYNSVIETIALWIKQYVHPVNQAAKTASGKFFLIGLSAFFVFMIVDEFFSKRYFHPRIKN